MLSQAWHTEAFSRMEKRDFKKALKDILSDRKPKQAQTPEEILAVMQQFHAQGAPMTFRQIN